MSRLQYEFDLRRYAGQVDSASELVSNLADVSALASGFDWENWEPWSLDDGHVYDDGLNPLKKVKTSNVAFINATTNATWTTVITMSIANLLTGANPSAVFCLGQANAPNLAAGDLSKVRITRDGVALGDVQIGEAKTVAEGMVYAVEASAASHNFTLDVYLSQAAPAFPSAVTDSILALFSVNR